jgi:hypothetical protein
MGRDLELKLACVNHSVPHEGTALGSAVLLFFFR